MDKVRGRRVFVGNRGRLVRAFGAPFSGLAGRTLQVVGLLLALGGAGCESSERLPYTRSGISSAGGTTGGGSSAGSDSSGSGGNSSSGSGGSNSSPVGLAVEFQSEPQIDHANSRTRIVVDVVVRDGSGTPLSAEDFTVELLQTEEGETLSGSDALDVESVLEQQATEVISNLNFQLVLDASYSLLQSDSFGAMKEAAASTVASVRETWTQRGGSVTTGVLWFDQWLYHAQGEWGADEILSLTEPTSGTATRLLGAVHYMADHMYAQYEAGVADQDRDRHVMLVFTDGKDNISTLDSTTDAAPPCRGYCGLNTEAECQDGTLVPVCPNETTTGLCSTTEAPGAVFRTFGYPCVDMEAVQAAASAHPNLVVHVVGLGSDVSHSELGEIAEAGNGTTVFGSDSRLIGDLFDEVVNQFVNIQSYGASIPQPQGTYRFGLLVKLAGNSSTQVICSFDYSTLLGIQGDIKGTNCSLR